MAGLPVIIDPPSPRGSRRVRVNGELLGLAHNLANVAELLRRAGMEGLDADDVARSDLIEWRGGGPQVWAESPP